MFRRNDSTRSTLTRASVALVTVTSLVAACGGSDDADGGDTDASAADSAPAEAPADDAPAPDTSGGDGPSPDTVGNGLLRIDGTEYPGFDGDCQILREGGSVDVGDLGTPGYTVVVGVDNVDEANPDNANDLNFLMTREEAFRVRNQSGDITSIAEIGGRTSSGSQDYTVVVFSGTLEDGRAVEAEIVCELQNQF